MKQTIDRLRKHAPEYLIEGFALGVFMVSAGLFTTAFESPGSWLRQSIENADLRRALIGVAMGLTAIALIYSPWGSRSGAHMNPAVTIAYWRMRKIHPVDAVGYIVAQFIGGTCGVLLVAGALGSSFTASPVNWVATQPGDQGQVAAFIAEVMISALLMGTVLLTSNSIRLSRYTGVFAGLLVAIYIAVEAPLSGMSMNPARSFASAAPAMMWQDLWVYFIAPVTGMVLAAWVYTRITTYRACAKLCHPATQRCIHCGFEPRRTASARVGPTPAFQEIT
jgi:aquaporin Z